MHISYTRDQAKHALSTLLSCKNNLFVEYRQLKEQFRQSEGTIKQLNNNQQHSQQFSKLNEDLLRININNNNNDIDNNNNHTNNTNTINIQNTNNNCNKHYEDKLSKLAEMHADLMELNNHLLRTLLSKDHKIRSLERQLRHFKGLMAWSIN